MKSRISVFSILAVISFLALLQLCSASSFFVDSDFYLHQQAPNLPKDALEAGVKAYENANSKGLIHNSHLAIADMALPSSKARLWVFDMKSHQLLYRTYVAHGKGSGALYATHFSNQTNSLESSVGVYITGKQYYGNDGLSMQLYGQEPHFNGDAFSRDIVMHGASYVSAQFIKLHHRLGRSWGCPAVSEKMIKPISNTLKNGALLMVYYPMKQWLNHSQFLNTSI